MFNWTHSVSTLWKSINSLWVRIVSSVYVFLSSWKNKSTRFVRPLMKVIRVTERVFFQRQKRILMDRDSFLGGSISGLKCLMHFFIWACHGLFHDFPFALLPLFTFFRWIFPQVNNIGNIMRGSEIWFRERRSNFVNY